MKAFPEGIVSTSTVRCPPGGGCSAGMGVACGL